MHWYLQAWKRATDFGGRSRRREFWTFTLVNWVIAVVLGTAESLAGIASEFPGTVSGVLIFLVVVVPGIAVAIRRLHDTGRSGFWLFIGLVPVIGQLALLFFYLQDSHREANEYGACPK